MADPDDDNDTIIRESLNAKEAEIPRSHTLSSSLRINLVRTSFCIRVSNRNLITDNKPILILSIWKNRIHSRELFNPENLVTYLVGEHQASPAADGPGDGAEQSPGLIYRPIIDSVVAVLAQNLRRKVLRSDWSAENRRSERVTQ